MSWSPHDRCHGQGDVGWVDDIVWLVWPIRGTMCWKVSNTLKTAVQLGRMAVGLSTKITSNLLDVVIRTKCCDQVKCCFWTFLKFCSFSWFSTKFAKFITAQVENLRIILSYNSEAEPTNRSAVPMPERGLGTGLTWWAQHASYSHNGATSHCTSCCAET